MLKYLALFFAITAGAVAAPVKEIEALLSYVGTLEGASFIRNGEAYSPAEAASHLRLKCTKQKGQIVSAEDFIRLCGTKSTVSGKPYLIRFADGREEEAAQVLLKQLKVIRSGSEIHTPADVSSPRAGAVRARASSLAHEKMNLPACLALKPA
jgi:hypothetical protein